MPTRAILRAFTAACLSLFLAACAGDRVVAPRATIGVATGTGAAMDDAPDSASVLWPSDALWAGFGSAADDGAYALDALTALPAEPDIRIGVVQSASAVVLGGTSNWVVRDRATGAWLGSGTPGQTATVTLASVPETWIYFQVTCSGVAAVNTLKAQADGLGYYTLTELAPLGCTRLLIGRLPTSSTTAQRDAFKVTLRSQGLSTGGEFARTITIGNQVVYKVTRATGSAQSVNPVIVTAASGGYVTIGAAGGAQPAYRGRGEVRMNSAGTLAGINELPMEQYLYGVLPRELGPIQYPEVEAQKAQAVAARTYAMAGRGKRNADGYDLRATTDDQVYGGYSVEHPVSNAAVDATRGMVATYAGKLISTNFFSTSGGHTADNDEAFTGAPVAYLRGVPDAERGASLEHVPSLAVFRAHANPKSLRNAAEGDFESDWASYHRWSYEWSAEEISAVISAYAGRPVGQVLEINVTSRGPSGRALSIEYVTEGGVVTDARKDGIRGSLRYINASGNPVNLPSTLFFVEPVKEQGKLTGGFRVYGGGFGHGVGLSQTGAVGMAQKGHRFDEILAHYYQGTALEAAY
ncbi:MAG TPA: SpoIID/LytB domain-containing protein [Gemmatimonadaceae bacterium]